MRLRFSLAAVIAAAWVVLTALLVFVGTLMSVDEEWRGWSDMLLNPLVMIPYILATALAAATIVFLIRSSRRARDPDRKRPLPRRGSSR